MAAESVEHLRAFAADPHRWIAVEGDLGSVAEHARTVVDQVDRSKAIIEEVEDMVDLVVDLAHAAGAVLTDYDGLLVCVLCDQAIHDGHTPECLVSRACKIIDRTKGPVLGPLGLDDGGGG